MYPQKKGLQSLEDPLFGHSSNKLPCQTVPKPLVSLHGSQNGLRSNLGRKEFTFLPAWPGSEPTFTKEQSPQSWLVGSHVRSTANKFLVLIYSGEKTLSSETVTECQRSVFLIGCTECHHLLRVEVNVSTNVPSQVKESILAKASCSAVESTGCLMKSGFWVVPLLLRFIS